MVYEHDDDSRIRLLRLINEDAYLTQREIAKRLGFSLGKVNYLLHALAKKGAVKVRNFRRSDSKAAYAYVLTAAGIAEKARLTGAFIARKLQEYEALGDEIDKMRKELADTYPGKDNPDTSTRA